MDAKYTSFIVLVYKQAGALLPVRVETPKTEVKKMKKRTWAVLSLFLIGIVAAGSASAFGWRFWQSDEKRQEIQNALESGDFNSWKSAIESGLTEERFVQMAERHREKSQMRLQRENMRALIEAGDYDAYREAANAIGIQPMAEEDFNKLVELRNARGDCEAMQQLRANSEEWPLPIRMGKGAIGFGRGGY